MSPPTRTTISPPRRPRRPEKTLRRRKKKPPEHMEEKESPGEADLRFVDGRRRPGSPLASRPRAPPSSLLPVAPAARGLPRRSACWARARLPLLPMWVVVQTGEASPVGGGLSRSRRIPVARDSVPVDPPPVERVRGGELGIGRTGGARSPKVSTLRRSAGPNFDPVQPWPSDVKCKNRQI